MPYFYTPWQWDNGVKRVTESQPSFTSHIKRIPPKIIRKNMGNRSYLICLYSRNIRSEFWSWSLTLEALTARLHENVLSTSAKSGFKNTLLTITILSYKKGYKSCFTILPTAWTEFQMTKMWIKFFDKNYIQYCCRQVIFNVLGAQNYLTNYPIGKTLFRVKSRELRYIEVRSNTFNNLHFSSALLLFWGTFKITWY